MFHPDMYENFSLRETVAEVQVEWRIERFLSLAEDPMYYELHSPAFSLSDAQWFLEVRPPGDTDDNGWIDLWLYKRYSTSKKHAVKFTLGIRRRDGSVYKSFDSEDEFQEYDCGGKRDFLRFSELRQPENVLTTDGSLRVFGIVRLAEPTVLDEVVDTPRELPFRAMHTEEVSSEWMVEDFTSLPKDKEFSLKSPTFSMAGSTWCMEVFPNGNDDLGWVSLYLIREGSTSEKQTVVYTLGIRKHGGTPQRLYHDKAEFDTDTGYGRLYFIKSSELLDPRNGLVSEGSVTFFCTARAHHPSPSATAAVTEGGAPTSSDASDEEGASRTTPSKRDNLSQRTNVTVLENFRNLFVNEVLGDVTIQVQEQKIAAHRAILAARSSVFAAMFEHDTEERRTGIVNIEDFDAATFRTFLTFLYSGDVEVVSADNAIPLYRAADKYNVQDLRMECLRHLQDRLCLGSVCEVVLLAFEHSEQLLLEAAKEFFVDHAKEIIVTPEWQAMTIHHPALTNELIIEMVSKRL